MGARGDFGLRINLLRSRVLRDEQRDCYHRRYILMNLALLVLLAVGSPSPDDPVPQQPPPTQNPTAGVASTSSPAVPYERPASWKLVIPNLASDQKRIWLFPFRLLKGEDLIPAAAIVATTVGLVALDPYTAPAFRNTTAFSGFNKVFTGNATVYGTVATPFAMYVGGMFLKDSKMKSTALLAGEAMGDSYLVTTVMKDVDRRLRPIAVTNGDYRDTWFQDNTHPFLSDGSFPSGHSIAAFSVATVIARQYKNHKWVPYVAYGLAGVIGFSRLTLSAHFLSDVFMGAALGYTIGRYDVLRN
jgi:membrane-associated phospholipid phosphatase